MATPTTHAAAAAEQVRHKLTLWIKDWFAEVRRAYSTVQPRSDLDFSLIQEAMAGFVSPSVRAKDYPLPSKSALITRFASAVLGLYGWAEHIATGKAHFGAHHAP